MTLMEEEAAAKRIHRPVSALRHWRTKGVGGPRYLKMGRRVFYRDTDLDEFLARCVVEPGEVS